MIKRLQAFFDRRLAPRENRGVSLQQLRIAAAALLVEVTRADHEVQAQELAQLRCMLTNFLELTNAEVDTVVELATGEVEAATSLYQFTRLINDHYSSSERLQLIYCMWRVAFADARMDKYEEHLIRRVSGLLHVADRDFVQARTRARDEMRHERASGHAGDEGTMQGGPVEKP